MAIIVKITKEKYERTLKLTGNFEQMNINGQYNIDLYNINRFALHTSPYIVFTNHGYTKHYYVEADRIASKIGGGMSHSGNNFGEHVDAFDVDYRMKAELSKEQERVHLDSAQSNLGKQFEVLVDVDFRKLQEFLAVDKPEKEIFYFHKDHLGSSTQISDMSRRVIHHIEYMPTGELFAEQRDYWHTPYRFNGKELDEETGLYYYGARYYTPELGIWLSVDPLSDKYPSMSAFMYCAGNPVVLVDPDGREIEITGKANQEITKGILLKTFGAKSDRFYFEDNKLKFNGDKEGFSKSEKKILNGVTSLIDSPELTVVKFERNSLTDIHGGEYTKTIADNPDMSQNEIFVDPNENHSYNVKTIDTEYKTKIPNVNTTNIDKAVKDSRGEPIPSGTTKVGEISVQSSVASRFFHGLGHVLYPKSNEQSKVVKFNNDANKLYGEPKFIDWDGSHSNRK
ncbi:MAG: RHS repeat domain-containing protein [Bacteroidales bacterium]